MPYDYSGFSIMHCEDDLTDALVMQKMLQKFNYNGSYTNVSVGQEIVESLRDKNNPLPGLILLDIGLPGMNGIEILSALRNDKRTMAVPIMMLSGSSSLRDYQLCMVTGANGYIKKTSDRDSFSKTCEGMIEGWARLSNQEFY